jgi:hypothetical protein
MPCFSCNCFSDGKGRHGERLNGGRGYCELHDQEYWRGHECNDFAPTWYGNKSSGSALKEPQGYGFLGHFKSKKQASAPEPSSFLDIEADDTMYDEFEEDLDFETDLYLEDKLDALEEELSVLQEKLFDLEYDEPEEYTSTAYERWEHRMDLLEEQISEIEDQISEIEDQEVK